MVIKTLLILGFIIGILACIGLGVFLILRYIKAKNKGVDQIPNPNYVKYGDEPRHIKDEDGERKLGAKLARIKGQVVGCIVCAIALLTGVILIPGNIHQVDATQVAVVKNLGTIKGTRDPGLHWDFYMTNDYEYFSTTLQEISLDSQAYSSDTQYVGLTVEMQYKIDSSRAVDIYKEYRTIDALESKIKVVAIDKVKAVYAKYKATEIMANREAISNEITALVETSVEAQYPVFVETIAVPNIDFSDTFEKSVEDALAAKVAAEQAALQAQSEAEKKVTEAKATADAAKLDAEAQAYAIEQKAKADKEKAQYEADALLIAAKADAEKAKIEADAAEYQGQKEAAIKLQALASVNGWTVVKYTDPDGTTYNKLVKSDGTIVSDAELAAGVKNLLASEYYAKWDGKLPTYYMDKDGTVTVITP